MTRTPSKTTSRRAPSHPWLRRLLWGGLAFAAVVGVGLAIAWSLWSREADAYLMHFALRVPKTITKVLDRNGDVIGLFAEENRVVIPYGDIPKAFVHAVIATEDAGFMDHGGISIRGFGRAAFTFVTSLGRRREGGSTLTMQLVRTVTAKRQKRVDRKLKEIILARKLEKAYTKKQIFEQYANEVYLGGGRYGIEAAAQFYFGKSAPQLNVEECALLAGLVQNPNWYNPYNPDPRARAAALARRNHVMRRMVSENYLREAEAKILQTRPIKLARGNALEEAIAPYPVEEVRKYLYEKYGMERVLSGGLEVHTTIDSVWQENANLAVRKGLKAVDRKRGFRKEGLKFIPEPDTAQLPGWKRFFEVGDQLRGVILGWKGGKAQVRFGKVVLDVPETAFAWAGKGIQGLLVRGAAPLFEVKAADSEGNPTQVELDQEPDVEGALLAVEPATGEIRAMVGGYDFKRSKFNRSWQAARQVGSTMKAYVYGAAFQGGRSPASLVEDIPTRITFGKDVYEPKNYERDFWGPITIWEALRDSRNLPAVRTLDEVGCESVIGLARKMGVEGRIPAVPSMALGSADLSLRDMVRGYATISNGGKQSPAPFLIKKVMDRTGKVLETHEGVPGEEALDPISNFQLIQCLQGVAQAGTGARSNEVGWPVAGKTGTTDDHTDAWFIGFSTRVACGVWVGLDTKKTLYRGADGAKVALPIWVDFMKGVLPTTEREEFQAPEGVEWADIDNETGLRAAGGGGRVLHLAFKPGTSPRAESDAGAVLRIKEAKDKAHGQAVEDRAWGTHLIIPQRPPESAAEWVKEDPNK